MFTLGVIIVVAILTFLMMLMGGFAPEEAGGGSFLFLAVLVLFGVAIFIPSLAVQVRRFHDQDKSGWFVLLGFIPYVGGLIVLIFMCLEGTRGPNRFGSDPKGVDHEAVFS